MHSFFKPLALLVDSTRLQQIVIFSDYNGSMSLLRPDALGNERAAMAMSAPLETVLDPMLCAFFEPTALARPGHARKVGAICAWLNHRYGKGKLCIWVKQNPVRTDLEAPPSAARTFSPYVSIFVKQ